MQHVYPHTGLHLVSVNRVSPGMEDGEAQIYLL